MSTIENIYRLSPLQEGMLFHSLSDPDAGQYVEQALCTVEGDLDPAALRRGWEAAVARHPVLRASFHWEEVDRPVQVVYRRVDLPWREEDWRGLPEEAQAARFEALLDGDRRLGFDLDRPPLLRVALVRLGERTWRFLWSHHHLLLDGWSLGRVLQEVFAGYSGALSALPPSRPYVDYIAWLEQQSLAEAEAFWRRTLAGFATPTPLPLAVAPAVRGTPSYEERSLALPPAESSALEEAARRAGVTLGTLVQAAWAIFLSRTTGEEDVVFGTVVSGRPPHLRGSESMVGLFINTLPVRVRIEERDPLAAWLRQLQAQLLELRRFEHSPLAEIQKWSDVRPGEPLFQTLVAFENYPRDASLLHGRNGLEVRDVEVYERTNYPLNFAAVPLPEGLQLRLSWDRRHYDPDTAERLLGHLRTLLTSLASGLDRPLEELSLLDDAGRRHLLEEGNGATAEVPGVPVDVLFEKTAAERADAPAVVGPDGTATTYRELWERANVLAGRLRALGVGPEVPVGLCLERSADLIAAMLGVWQAGGAWVPLDPELPGAARAARRTRGALARGRRAGARLSPPARPHGRAVRPPPLFAAAGRAPVSDRRPGPLAARQQPGDPRTHRPPGEDPWAPRRVRRDRGCSRPAPRRARGCGDRPGRSPRGVCRVGRPPARPHPRPLSHRPPCPRERGAPSRPSRARARAAPPSPGGWGGDGRGGPGG